MYTPTMGTRVVGPSGPKTARIVFVGEAPGAEEESAGAPFVGPSGRVLDAALRQVGIDRTQCYLTNVMQVRPPRNDFSAFYQGRTPSMELLNGVARLGQELSVIKPHVIVALGNEALKALTGKSGIMERRGYVHASPHGKVVATIHPANVLRDPGKAFYPLLCFDLEKAKREAHTPALTVPKRTILIRPTLQEVRHHLERFERTLDPITFDIETEVGGPAWYCIAFSDSPDWAISIPTSKSWGGITDEYVETVIPLIKRVLENPLIPKVAQNAQFDVLHLRAYHGIATQSVVFDTMTAHHTIYPELPKSLECLASLYTNQPYYKDMDRIPPSLWEYNGLDAAVTYECYKALDQELGEFGLREFYQEYVLPLMEPLLEMQEKGVCVDVDQREVVARTLVDELDDEQAELNHAAYGWVACQVTPDALGGQHHVGLNAHSPKQLQEFLFETLRLPRAYKRKTGAVTTDEDAILKLAKSHSHPALRSILTIRNRRKLLSTYVLAPLGPDNRLRCSYVVGGTETGRLASRESIFGTGTNLQNVPKGVARRLLIPAPGLTFVQADLSQAEARVVAYLAEDERLIELFNRAPDPVSGKRFDVHRENAAFLFHGGDATQVTDSERECAKRLVHAANYGIGPVKFQEVLREAGVEVSRAEAERLLNLYHARFPLIRRWHARTEEELRRSRVLSTPVGRKRTFFGRWSDELLREAYAYVPQSTVADVLNRGLVDLRRLLVSVDSQARLVLTVHDSVVVECRPSHVRPVARAIRRCLERPIEIYRKECLIPCDLSEGPNWDGLTKMPLEV